MDRTRDQALTTIFGGVADAFDLSKEDPRVVERKKYGKAKARRSFQFSKR